MATVSRRGLLLALAALALAPPSTHATFPGRNGSLAFNAPEYFCPPASDCSGTLEIGSRIGIVGVTGKGRRRLPCSGSSADVNTCGDADPAWSPDGRRLLFNCDAICLTTARGPSRRLPLPSGSRDPAWSPDGERLAFTRIDPGSGSPYVYTAALDGSDVRRLGPPKASLPDWSRRSAIAFERIRRTPLRRPSYEDRDLWLMRAGQTEVRRVTFRGGSSPSWSPTGRRLAFVRGYNVYVIGADGRHLRQVTRRGGSRPAWSPDGRWIAYCREDEPEEEVPTSSLYRVRPDGTGRRRIRSEGCAPDWQAR